MPQTERPAAAPTAGRSGIIAQQNRGDLTQSAEPAQSDLFGEVRLYPVMPGSKERGRLNSASRKAAETIAPSAKTLRAKVFATLKNCGPMTADEVADELGVDVLSIRPRVAECVKLGLVMPTDQRRLSSRKTPQTVWRIAAGVR